MQFADEAFDILGFTQDEKYNVFKCTAAMMHMGNMTKDFVPVGKEEQAEIKDDTNAQKVATLCGIDCEWMITYFCKPKLKVGTEWVQKGSTCTGAANSVSGIARAIYERCFRIVVDKCNETLCDPTMKRSPTSVSLTLLGSKYLTTTVSSKSVLIMLTRNCNNFLTSICSHSSKRCMSRKVLTGQMLILVWIFKSALTCLRNQWRFSPFLKRSHCFQKQLTKHSKKS